MLDKNQERLGIIMSRLLIEDKDCYKLVIAPVTAKEGRFNFYIKRSLKSTEILEVGNHIKYKYNEETNKHEFVGVV